MVNPRDPRTPYQQIADDLREKITRGVYGPGDRLPSYSELSRTWNVSVPTVQRALRTLKAEGLITGSTGKGLFVREQLPMMAVSASYLAPGPDGTWPTWKSEAAKRGMTGTQRLAYVGRVPVDDLPDDIAISGGEENVITRRRIMYLDGVPVQLADSIYPLSVAEGTPLAEPQPIPGGTPKLLAELGYQPWEYEEIVTARMPTPEEADQLQLADGVPVIRIMRTSTTADGRVVEVMVMTLAADRHQLHYRLPVHT